MSEPLTDAVLRDILVTARSFACVGVSPDPIRPSNYVAGYLHRRNYRIVSINPKAAGTQLFGGTVLASLEEIEEPIDVLDIFRRPEAVPGIVENALRVIPDLSCVWLQIGVFSEAAREMCADAGVRFVENRCPKIEHQRLFGELRKAGFATGIVSSKL